jgi:hypothetical protein
VCGHRRRSDRSNQPRLRAESPWQSLPSPVRDQARDGCILSTFVAPLSHHL